jgi:hypothetical protein
LVASLLVVFIELRLEARFATIWRDFASGFYRHIARLGVTVTVY